MYLVLFVSVNLVLFSISDWVVEMMVCVFDL